MPALFGLVLMTALLSPPAAQAGSWTYVVTGDNTGTSFTDNGMPGYVPPYTFKDAQGKDVVQSGSVAALPSYTINRQNNGPSGSGCNINITVHAQVTFTWHPDPNLPSDPPPPSVMVLEGATSFWSANSGDAMHVGSISGTAANGLGDALYTPPNNPQGNPPVTQTANQGVGYSGPQPDQSFPSPVPADSPHFTRYPSSSGTVTVASRTLTATATAVAANWYYGAKALAFYSASIHAQPYNFHQVQETDNGDGTLSFTYLWLSTDGQLGDIASGCVVHEFVTYNGPNPFPLPAPFVGSLINPTILPSLPQPGSAGVIYDDQLMPGTAKPYQSATVVSTQKWEYDDSATGELDVIVPGPDSGPLPIARTIGVRPPYIPYWWYSVTKNGSTAWAPLPNQ